MMMMMMMMMMMILGHLPEKRILFNAPTKQFQVPTQVDKLKGILSLINVIF